MVAEHLPVEEVASIKQLFHSLDTDKNGTLSLEELKKGLHIFGHLDPDLDIHMLMEAVRFNSIIFEFWVELLVHHSPLVTHHFSVLRINFLCLTLSLLLLFCRQM